MKKRSLIVLVVAIMSLFVLVGCNADEETASGVERNINELVFTNPHGLPETPHGGNILHAWNMSFNEIIDHLPYIAEAGFGVIQTSPIGRALERGAGQNRRWYDLYQPTHFTIGNHLGTEEEFRAMTAAAAEFGIFVIVDALPNHTTAYWNQIDPELRMHEPSLFHNRPDTDDTHYTLFNREMNFGNRRSFVRSNLLGLWDFYTGRTEFQNLYMQFLGEKIDAGASGFRYDAMHHVELPNDPEDIRSDFWPIIANFVNEHIEGLGRIPFQYGEILGGGYRANHYLHALYADHRMLVTPYAFSRHIMGTISGGQLFNATPGFSGWNSADFLVNGNPPQVSAGFGRGHEPGPDLGGHVGFASGVVPWVESHDQYGNEGISRHLNNDQILVGWALIAARAETSPLFFVRPGEGFVNNGNMFVLQLDGTHENAWGHQTFYRDPAVASINWFANYFGDQPELATTHDNIALIERGPVGARTGAVIANVGAPTVDIMLPVELVDGAYICQISGDVYIVSNGVLSGPGMASMSVVVLRDPGEVPTDLLANVSALPGTANYNDPAAIIYHQAGVEVTLVAQHTTRQNYTITRNGEVVVSEVNFTHGDIVVIGANGTLDDIYVLTVFGENDQGTIVQSFVYIIADAPVSQRIRIEYIRTNDDWEHANIWAWNPADVFTGGWPGPSMEWAPRFDGEGYAWVFYFEEGIAIPINLMFNNAGAGEQTNYASVTTSTQIIGNNNINQNPHTPIITGDARTLPSHIEMTSGRNIAR